jgi:hypothetical protein
VDEWVSNFDDFVKSRKTLFFVIPAEAGIQSEFDALFKNKKAPQNSSWDAFLALPSTKDYTISLLPVRKEDRKARKHPDGRSKSL